MIILLHQQVLYKFALKIDVLNYCLQCKARLTSALEYKETLEEMNIEYMIYFGLRCT